MSFDFQRLERVLAEAAAKGDAEERAAYLAQVCGDDAELRAEVERLLAAHEKAGDFLETPFQPIPDKTKMVSESDIAIERSGAMIGRYKLLEEIGEGGFGVVYMAEQLEPVQRKVALKIIKAGMDTREVVARFEAERQALALMDHPNIAQVFDGGATQTGRPYFVMELVRGVAITDFCDQRKLSTRERLQLFIQVCRAVQHAHQKGIIHRDLKPSNILVTLIDGEAVPKIIDFGVAKALGQKLTDKTLFTSFLRMVGTPAYMSPEQADLSGVDVDTRSDIYSLGVLLYELLTGVTPFHAETLREAALDEIRRMIREIEPPKPSTRLQALAAADVRRFKSTGNRQPTEEEIRASSRRLLQIKEKIRLVRGDLDWIVMKCLEKDRQRRYETADSLAGDIERHLCNEPVVARPPSRLYRLQKSVRRDRLAYVATCLVALAIISGLGMSTWTLIREKQALERAVVAELEQSRLRTEAQRAQMQAETNEKKALEEAARSKQVTHFLNDTLQNIAAVAFRDRAVIRSILDATTNRINEELRNQPEVGAELRTVIGLSYLFLLRDTEAETMFREALAIQEQLFGNESLPVAASLERLANVLSLQAKHKEAETLLRQALAMRRKLLGEEHRTVADTLDYLAMVLLRQSQTALAPQTESLLTEAEVLESEALTTRQKLFGDEHLDIAQSFDGLSLVLCAEGKTAEAERGEREALAMRRKLLGDENLLVAMSFLNLADVLTVEGKHDEAEHLYRDALAMRRRLLGSEHPDVAYALGHLAVLLRKQGNLSEAEAANREALAINVKEFGNEHPFTVITRVQLANVLRDKGRLAEAESLYREVLNTRWRARPKNFLALLDTVYNLASVLERQDKYAEAEALYREMLALQRPLLPPDDSNLASTLAFAATAMLAQDNFAGAEPFVRESLAIHEKKIPDSWRTFNARSLLGGSLLGQKKYAEAGPLLTSGYEGMKQREDQIPTQYRPMRLKEALQRLVQLYEATGQSAKAAECRRKLTQTDIPAPSKQADTP